MSDATVFAHTPSALMKPKTTNCEVITQAESHMHHRETRKGEGNERDEREGFELNLCSCNKCVVLELNPNLLREQIYVLVS